MTSSWGSDNYPCGSIWGHLTHTHWFGHVEGPGNERYNSFELQRSNMGQDMSGLCIKHIFTQWIKILGFFQHLSTTALVSWVSYAKVKTDGAAHNHDSHCWFTMFPWRKETIWQFCFPNLIQVLVELRLVITQWNHTEILSFWTRFATKWCLHQLPLLYFFFRKDRKLSSTIKNLPKVRTSEPVPSDGQMVPVPRKPSCGSGMRFLVWDCGWKMLEEKGP